MIRVFNSAYRNTDERLIPLSDVNIHTQEIDQFTGAPYIIFEHTDYPLGALTATFDGTYWQADLC
jgi:hypothetical protein